METEAVLYSLFSPLTSVIVYQFYDGQIFRYGANQVYVDTGTIFIAEYTGLLKKLSSIPGKSKCHVEAPIEVTTYESRYPCSG